MFVSTTEIKEEGSGASTFKHRSQLWCGRAESPTCVSVASFHPAFTCRGFTFLGYATGLAHPKAASTLRVGADIEKRIPSHSLLLFLTMGSCV